MFDLSNMFSTTQLISIMVMACVFFLIVFVAVVRDEAQNKNSRKMRNSNEWLFSRWDEKIYDAFVKQRPEEFLKSLGVDIDAYRKNSDIVKNFYPNFKKLAARKFVGIVLMFVSVLLFLILGSSGFLFALLCLLIAMLVYEGDIKKVEKEAEARKNRIAAELPRFLDMLQTALYIDIPVDEAIVITSKHLDTFLISEELMASMAETQIGATSWQKALEGVAEKYDVDTLSDFALYLITGYEKGLSIYDVVKRQASDAQKTTLINAEANASKLNTSVVVPIALYKMAPLLILIAFPVVLQGLGML